MININWTPALAAAFFAEEEEIEKVAGLWDQMVRGAVNTGKKMWKEPVKAGKFKKNIRTAKERAEGVARFTPVGTGPNQATLGDLAKFHVGRTIARNPRSSLGVGAAGTALVGGRVTGVV